jgi:hypothetical protein
MSEPHYTTNSTKLGPCQTCGAEVTLREHIGLYEGKSMWRPETHDAPCGLPCLGGGIRNPKGPNALKNVHRKDKCPRCEEILD